MKQWLKIAWGAAKNWKADNAFKHSAAVSFYTLFSLAPITLVALAVAGFFLGREAAQEQLEKQVTQLVGPASAELVRTAADSARSDGDSWFATLTGVGLLLFGATTVFAQLQDSFNQIWKVRPKPSRRGWIILILHRLLSFAMVLVIGFLLLVSLVLSTTLSALLDRFMPQTDALPFLLRITDLAVGMAVVALLFALLFKALPDVRLRWSDVWIGAAVTAALFTAGRFLIAMYLSRSTVASVYGAAGSLVALLIWVYYSCAIVFFGAEFIRAYRQAHHLRVEPNDTAVVVREEIVSEEPPTPSRHRAPSPAGRQVS